MNNIARLSLVAITAFTLGLGFAAGANALPGVKPKGATLVDLTNSAAATPEIAAAEQRVDQAKAQVDLANKQVNASRALLKAAQADLKAAIAEVDALKLGAQAQGLVEQTTGMQPAKAAPVPIATKVPGETKDKDEMPAAAPAATTAPTPAPAPAPTVNPDEARIKPEGTSDAPEPILLR